MSRNLEGRWVVSWEKEVALSKIPNFSLKNAEKQTGHCESNAGDVSFGWSHHRISSTDSIVRTTLYSIIDSTTGKYCSVAFIWMVTL